MSAPCPTCPWRRSSTVGGADIPGFDQGMMDGLASTVGQGDAFRPVMACHYSRHRTDGEPGPEPKACLGYVYRHGWSNLNVRLLFSAGVLDPVEIAEACAGLDLFPDFATMLAAYQRANL